LLLGIQGTNSPPVFSDCGRKVDADTASVDKLMTTA